MQRSLHGQDHDDSDSNSKADGSRSTLRVFHNAVFDTLKSPGPKSRAFGVVPWGRSGGTVYVGQGARLYDAVGKWVPEGLVGWLIRRQGTSTDGPEGVKRANSMAEKNQAEEQEDGVGLPRWGASSASSETGVWEKL